ncbi:Glucose-methanol-choline oxidoreductase [Neofusicoccum parvum]|nr:Glucose-methanol-choline oxidoreductase [Neofusicoccum parvum]
MFLCILLFAAAVQARLGRLARVVGRDASLRESYDFVVAGGGTSGLTVADRLTEDPDVSVLVIEYGPLDQHEDSVLVPGLLDLDKTPYWFNLTSVPQEGLDNNTFQVPAAAVVGGGTVINGMFFDRAAAVDYDVWERLGNPGWGWKGLLPYFKKMEKFTPADEDFAAEWNVSWDLSAHGLDGPVQSSYPPYQYPSIKNFFRGCYSLGISTPPDPGAGNKTGVFWAPSSKDPSSQTRSYARSAHYDRVISSRPNYHLLPLHAVSKILFSDNKTTHGVEYLSRETGEVSTAKASKEVILAAGTIHTPQILQLSGVGSKELLDSFDIETVVDLPGVGYNLQDHPTIYTVWNYTNLTFPSADDLSSNTTFASQALAEYRASRTGPYTIVHQGGNTVAFLPLPSLLPANSSALLALLASTTPSQTYPSPSTPPPIFAGYAAQLTHLLPLLSTPLTPTSEYGFGASAVLPITLLHPLSRGSVRLTSRAPLAAPEVDYGAARAHADLALLAAAVRTARRLMATPAMRELGAAEVVPGPDVAADADLEAALRAQAAPGYQHVVGTSAMAPVALGGVVDPALAVHGVRGLRVVDASVMPVIPGTHTSGTVYAVAEKAADIIKRAHGITIGVLAEE